jgi:hypothetical protein
MTAISSALGNVALSMGLAFGTGAMVNFVATPCSR